MDNLAKLSPEAQRYSDAYYECMKTLSEDDQKKVLAAVGQDNVTDKVVVRFIKRVIAKAEAEPVNKVKPNKAPPPPQSSGTEDASETVPA